MRAFDVKTLQAIADRARARQAVASNYNAGARHRADRSQRFVDNAVLFMNTRKQTPRERPPSVDPGIVGLARQTRAEAAQLRLASQRDRSASASPPEQNRPWRVPLRDPEATRDRPLTT